MLMPDNEEDSYNYFFATDDDTPCYWEIKNYTSLMDDWIKFLKNVYPSVNGITNNVHKNVILNFIPKQAPIGAFIDFVARPPRNQSWAAEYKPKTVQITWTLG